MSINNIRGYNLVGKTERKTENNKMVEHLSKLCKERGLVWSASTLENPFHKGSFSTVISLKEAEGKLEKGTEEMFYGDMRIGRTAALQRAVAVTLKRSRLVWKENRLLLKKEKGKADGGGSGESDTRGSDEQEVAKSVSENGVGDKKRAEKAAHRTLRKTQMGTRPCYG